MLWKRNKVMLFRNQLLLLFFPIIFIPIILVGYLSYEISLSVLQKKSIFDVSRISRLTSI
ncbi:hypothetical protein CGZ75_08740 [Paenibacillus herberti]|uniref:Uncharacterized protein n=1 Tax=Paenibacillus herberti TaxID=1619309 RepID=A0A229P4E3_9BACL|nr:hypothetical protein CGZ75_08740 [Paenibacillus herberti]